MKKTLCFLLILTQIAFGQTPELVKDISQSGFFPYKPIKFGNLIYFMNADERLGAALWKTDGTSAGTTKVKDGFLGTSDNYFTNEFYSTSQFPPWAETVVSNGFLYFITLDNDNNTKQLWRTDGSNAGTILLKKFTGPPSYTAIQNLTDVNGTLYFVGFDALNGFEIWKSDGTAAGTVFIKDVNPGTGDGFFGFTSPKNLTNLNGVLYFSEENSVNGEELWQSDGTSMGTVMVKDINAGANGSTIEYMKNLNGTLYFSADDGTTGKELWKSDGTNAGTVLVSNLVAGSGSSTPFQFFRFNNLNYFATSNGNFYSTDGTGVGTVLIDSYFPSNFVISNNSLFFRGGPIGDRLYKSDGTEAGTAQLLFATTLSNLYAFNNKVYFQAALGSFSNLNAELYQTDGTEAGTILLKNINPSNASSRPNSFIELNSSLYFLAYDGSYGNFFWKTDGTANGTQPVDLSNPINGGSTPKVLTKVGSNIFFSANSMANGLSLWKSDGTNTGTTNIDIRLVNHKIIDIPFIAGINNEAYLSAVYDGNFGSFLWKTDGTTTQNLKQFLAIKNIINFNNVAYLLATGTDNINRFYVSDGTDVGTVPIITTNNSSGNIIKVNNKLFFADINNLWVSDGTTAGTLVVKSSISPGQLTDVNGTLFFTVGSAIWKSDGTNAGTVLVKSFGNNTVIGLTNANGVLYFNSSPPPFSTDKELWKSDGTAAGTVVVTNINPTGGSNPAKITYVNGYVYFDATDGVNGFELWKTNVNTLETTLVKEINPNGNAFNRDVLGDIFLNVNGNLYFTATDGVNGFELWKSDGTSSGTARLNATQKVQIADINVDGSSYPQSLAIVGNQIYFSANDGINGRELWKVASSPLPLDLLNFTGKNENGSNILNWKTANEVALSHFEIERSENAKKFENKGQVKTNGGPSEKVEYQFIDTQITKLSSQLFYRLKMVDLDGSFKYSKIISLENKSQNEVSIYPNPTTDYFSISENIKFEKLQIVDLSGKILKEFLYQNGNKYSLSGLIEGIYLVKISNRNNLINSKIIVGFKK